MTWAEDLDDEVGQTETRKAGSDVEMYRQSRCTVEMYGRDEQSTFGASAVCLSDCLMVSLEQWMVGCAASTNQMRIRIEMAFGRLSTKWRIFRRNLDFPTELNSHIVEVHNFVIRSDGLNFVEVSDDKWESLEVESWDEGPEGNKGYLGHVDSCSGDDDDFNFICRNYILQEIISKEIIYL
eukprot:scaffold14179_cov49-Attheya_sp.AAC.3